MAKYTVTFADLTVAQFNTPQMRMKFQGKVAAFLGVPSNKVVITDVKSGSVIVDYVIPAAKKAAMKPWEDVMARAAAVEAAPATLSMSR